MERIFSKGYEWIWNGRMVYCKEVEREMRYSGQNTSEYGYPATTRSEFYQVVNSHPQPMVEYKNSLLTK